MKHTHGQFSKEYFVQSILSGLKGEVRHMVELLSHVSVEQAILMARKQEALLAAVGNVKGKVGTSTKNGGVCT